MANMRHCLECGYSRQGLPEDAVCPECGEADSLDIQKEICEALVDKPLLLLWRVMTFRRMPKGWWVVFEQKHRPRFKPWQFVMLGILFLSAFFALSSFIHIELTTTTFFYDANDPQQTVIQEVTVRTDKYYLTTVDSSYEPVDQQVLMQAANIKRSSQSTLKLGEKRSTRIAFGNRSSKFALRRSPTWYLMTYTIVIWLLNRFIWLPLIARDRRASPFQHAAQQTYVLYIAHLLWMITVSLLAFMALIVASLVPIVELSWITNPFNILKVAVMIFSPAMLWARLISTDNLKQEFPRRLSAGLILIGFTVLAALVVFRLPMIW